MNVDILYVDAKKDVVERTKRVHVLPDADVADVYRFLKSSIPKQEAVIYMNLRIAKSVPSEFSQNARAEDILKDGKTYYFYYEKE